MDPDYLTSLQNILERAQAQPQAAHQFQFKSVFGAVAGYIDGRIFTSFGQFGFALKLPPERCAALIAEGSAGALRYFPKGHIKKSYVVLPDRIIQDASRLCGIVVESIAYVLESGED